MYKTVITLSNRMSKRFLDVQHAHTMIYGVLGERGLWAQPQPGILVVQHNQPVNWADADSFARRTHTVQVTTPTDGQRIRYALIGNPVKAQYVAGKRGKPRALPPGEWSGWLEKRLSPALDLHTIDATLLPVARGRYHARNTTHHRVMYLGEATVTNSSALHNLQRDGVGRGKAYGCGLLITEPL